MTALLRRPAGATALVQGLVLCLASLASAGPLAIRSIHFASGPGFSVVASGTITTDAAGGISDWNLVVTTTERLARYTPGNTRNFSTGDVASDGTSLTVATSPDGVDEGGVLFFRSPNPFSDVGVALADFTGPSAAGGQAFYLAGSAFDFMPLGQPDGVRYVAATSVGGSVFDVTPLSFGGGVALSGTVTTDGTVGSLSRRNIVGWDLAVDQVTRDVFDKTNSRVLANLVDLAPDGSAVHVANPDGSLTFSKGFGGGHPFALQLADFDPSSFFFGQAGYFQGALGFMTVDLKAPRGLWAVTGPDPIGPSVPEPTLAWLLGVGAAGWFARRPRPRRLPRRHA